MESKPVPGPRLQTQNLPSVAENDPSATPGWSALSATASPARGKEMRGHLLNRLRPPALTHTWDMWHEKPPVGNVPAYGNQGNNQPGAVPTTNPMNAAEFAPHLSKLASISDVKVFWSVWNNFPFDTLPQKSSIHLFHTTIMPLWEDPRNVRGGAWTFRVPKSQSLEFWQHVCLLAIGEKLQEAIKDPTRQTFKDDICGVSFRPRFASTLITIWNRDGDHEKGIERIWKTIVESLPEQLKPKDGQYYYKKHSEHEGFSAQVPAAGATANARPQMPTHTDLTAARKQSADISQHIHDVSQEMDQVRKTMENVTVQDKAMGAKVEEAAKTAEDKVEEKKGEEFKSGGEANEQAQAGHNSNDEKKPEGEGDIVKDS